MESRTLASGWRPSCLPVPACGPLTPHGVCAAVIVGAIAGVRVVLGRFGRPLTIHPTIHRRVFNGFSLPRRPGSSILPPCLAIPLLRYSLGPPGPRRMIQSLGRPLVTEHPPCVSPTIYIYVSSPESRYLLPFNPYSHAALLPRLPFPYSHASSHTPCRYSPAMCCNCRFCVCIWRWCAFLYLFSSCGTDVRPSCR